MDRSQVDEELVAQVRAGDDHAFGQLYRLHQPQLLRYLSSLGVQDRQDVASQTWIDVARALARIDDRPDGFRRMLYTIARRRMVDELRRRSRRIEDPWGDPPDQGSVEDELGVDDALAMLATLPPAQAEVVALRVIVGMSPTEIGAITGQASGAVRLMVHRGLATLADQMRAPGPDGASSAPDVTLDHLPANHLS